MSTAWATILQGLSWTGIGFAWFACGLLCLGGLLLSLFSVSGTWLVLGAAIGAALLTGAGQFPSWTTLAIFLGICIAVDVLEWFAALWGVRRRGGSRAAGWMALLGGLLGAILGGFVVPLLGNIVGMMLGSFAFVFFYERHRLQQNAPAAHIALGAVLAAISILFLKMATTTALIMSLILGLF